MVDSCSSNTHTSPQHPCHTAIPGGRRGTAPTSLMPTSSPVSRWVPAASKQRMQSDDDAQVAVLAASSSSSPVRPRRLIESAGNPEGAAAAVPAVAPRPPTYVDVPKAARADLPAQPILALQRGSSVFGCWGGGRGCRGAPWSPRSPPVGLTAMRMSMSPRCLRREHRGRSYAPLCEWACRPGARFRPPCCCTPGSSPP